MKLPYKYKKFDVVDEKIIDNIVSSITEDDWYVYDFRKPMFSSSRASCWNNDEYNSILIRHSSEYLTKTIRNMPLYDKYYPLIEPILKQLEQHYNYRDYVAFFARLKPGANMHMHSDSTEFLETIHRIHIPIKTNDKALYFVQDEWTHWEKCGMYEFDNLRMHAAKNNGDEERIHLIINLYPNV